MFDIIGYAAFGFITIAIPAATVFWIIVYFGMTQYIKHYNACSNKLYTAGPEWFTATKRATSSTPLGPILVLCGFCQFLMLLVAFLDSVTNSRYEYLGFVGNLHRVYSTTTEFCAPIAGWILMVALLAVLGNMLLKFVARVNVSLEK